LPDHLASPEMCSYNMAVVQINDCDKETLSQLKELVVRFPRIIIILIDGHPDQLFLAHAFRTGVKDYFPDPVDNKLLYERIAAFFSNSISKEQRSLP
jgi:response regulator RpfG family c-di-GMP phosphodiesterase